MHITLIFLLNILLLSANISDVQIISTLEPEEPQPAKRLTMAGLNYLGGFVAQERKLAHQFTISYGVGVHYSFYDNSASPSIFGTRFINIPDKVFGRPYTTQAATPYLAFEVRSYNLARQVSRGRNIRGNSANYLALMGEIPFASGSLINVPNLELAYPVGVKYGLRRALGQHLYAEASLGGLLKISRSQTSLQPRIDAALAWYWPGR